MTANGSSRRDPLCYHPAGVLAAMLRERRVSAADVLEAHLARIAEHNPRLNAVVSLDAVGARERAAEADAAFRRGEVWGPLHGVPMTVKDGHDVAGLRTTIGGALDRVADQDGTVAARLRAAGAILVGHTNVAAWLADPLQTANPVFGRTNNPWDPERSPGGSSGGAAAALAAGMTALEIGSDLAGSIRLPAHFCGVYGLKTTEHRVPLTGFFGLPGPRPVRIMTSLGPLARDLDDLRLGLRLIAGPDGRDSDVPPVSLVDAPPRALRDLRLAAPELPGIRTGAAVRKQIDRVAEEAALAGAHVERRVPDLDWGELHGLFADLVATVTGIFDPTAELRDEQRTLAWYLGALDRRDRLIAAWQSAFADVDAVLLAPAATGALPHRETGAPVEVDGESISYWEVAAVLPICNLLGLPALVAPCGSDGGLPIGIQIVGARWSELRLLDIGRALEQAGILPGFRAPP
jgi:amidase